MLVYVCSLLSGRFLAGSLNLAMLACFVHLVYWFADVLLHYPQFLPKWSMKGVFNQPTNHQLVLSTWYWKFVCDMNSWNDWQTNLNFVYSFIIVHFAYYIASWVLSRGWSLIEMDTLCVRISLNEICAVLGFYAAQKVVLYRRFGRTCRSQLQLVR